jgi:hypothetical protein
VPQALVTVTEYKPLDAVVITFTCGYGGAEDVPLQVKQAMYLLISHWYENRLPINIGTGIPKELDFTISSLLWANRIIMI